MSECTPMATPMEEGIRLHLNMEEDFVNATEYQSLVGSLIYLTNTHPDIAYSVSCLNRFMAAPQHPHLKAARKVLSYIKGTISYGTFIPNQGDNTLMGYVDFDWGRDLDKRKSTIRMIFKIGDAPIHWSNKLQLIVVLSITEAEYRAVSNGAREDKWLRTLLEKLGWNLQDPTIMYSDNQFR